MKSIILVVVLAVSLLNAKVYRNNELNVVIDEENKLMWQDDNIQYENQQDAREYCVLLKYAGHDNWYLPNKIEFKKYSSIHNLSNGKGRIYVNKDLIYYWTNLNYFSYRIPDYDFYEERMHNKNNVRCVRKISPDENMINKNIIDKIPNSCSLVKDKVPKKPDVEKFEKRPYETGKEFKRSQRSSLNRWKSEINKYEKTCDFTAKIIDYNLMDELFKYSYNISLRGIGKKSVEELVPFKKAKYFVNTLNKKIVLKSVIGMNEDEQFYIKRVIYPVEKKKKLKEKKGANSPKLSC